MQEHEAKKVVLERELSKQFHRVKEYNEPFAQLSIWVKEGRDLVLSQNLYVQCEVVDAYCANPAESVVTPSYFSFGDFLIFDELVRFNIANEEAQVVFTLWARAQPLSGSERRQLPDDILLGKYSLLCSSLQSLKSRKVISFVTQSGLAALPTHHIRGPSVYAGH